MRNWASILASSNSLACLHVVGEDRRWLIPEVTETTRPPAYWKDFYGWLYGDGFGIILRWAQTFGDYVARGEHAPMTRRKRQMAEESMSEGQRLVYNLALAMVEAGREGRKLLVTDHSVDLWVRATLPQGEKAPKKLTLRKAMKLEGVHITHNEWRVSVPGAGYCYVLSNFDLERETRWDELRRFAVDPRDLMDGTHLGGDAL